MNVRAVTENVDLWRAPGDIVIFKLEIYTAYKSLSTKGLGGPQLQFEFNCTQPNACASLSVCCGSIMHG